MMLCVARYLDNGDLDDTFGDAGKVILDVPALSMNGSVAVNVSGNDSIVVSGSTGARGGVSIARLRPDGDLHSHLGTEAQFTNTFMEGHVFPRIAEVLIARSRQVVAGGNLAGGDSAELSQPQLAAAAGPGSPIGPNVANLLAPRVMAVGTVGESPAQQFIAASRYRIDGQLDPSFSNVGKAIFGFNDNHIVARTAASGPHNRTVVIADGDDQDLPILRAVRFLSDGALDADFGLSGKAQASWISGDSGAWVIRPRDAVIRGGDVIITGLGILSGSRHLVALRLREDGSADRDFGDHGVAVAPFTGPSRANSVAIDARTRIVSAGFAGTAFALARFLPNGRLDRDFNQQGMVVTHFDEGQSEAFVAKIDSPIQERVVAAGAAGDHFALARYREDGSLDPQFGTEGRVRTVVNEFGSTILDVDFDSQRRIIAAGSVATIPPVD